ncbi:cytochrome P450 [Artomyces pyxidatus]|uniref:Cytochrome P450 n=1 Tax=Artomyces pyxidatus TaxID=48021 RepID=A0ACB8TDZ3_9AGAM|nr:cytochrome P450 [Artomyces pyxidatus]
MHPILVVVGFFIVLHVVQRALEFRRLARGLGNFPGARQLFSPATIAGHRLPKIPGIISGGQTSLLLRKYQAFVEAGWDGYTTVCGWPRPEGFIGLADAAAIKEVSMHRARFPKPNRNYDLMTRLFGENIVEADGEQWKRYRKLAAPAFSEKNNTLVWNEAVQIMNDLFNDVWHDAPETTIEHVVDITMPARPCPIPSRSFRFGRRISWTDDSIPEGHRMSFKDTLHTVSSDIIFLVIVPKWAMNWMKRTRKLQVAYEEMKQYMTEMVHARRNAETKEERGDLLSGLVDEGGESPLSDSELNGNISVFLVAGHETTAHTVAFCLGLLALYQDKQEVMFQQIKSVIKELGRMPASSTSPSCPFQCLSALYEALRMKPSLPGIQKMSGQDQALMVSNLRGEKATIPVPKGTFITINAIGLHHNPRYWEDPEDYKPERFLGDWPRDAFLAFSGGELLLSSTFAEIESIAMLVMLVSKYKIEIKDEPQFAAETFEERKARILTSKMGLTTAPIRIPLTFKKR